jgi:hypothetical protein
MEASLTAIHDECLRRFSNLAHREEQMKEPVGRGQRTLACEAKAAKKEAKRNNKTKLFIFGVPSSLPLDHHSSIPPAHLSFLLSKSTPPLENRHQNNVLSLWVLFFCSSIPDYSVRKSV